MAVSEVTMSLKQDGPYDTRTLTKIFALSSIALGATCVWMVIDDTSRSWKRTQEEFRVVEIAQAKARADEAVRSINAAELEKAKAELAAAEAELDKHSEDRKKLEADILKDQASYENLALTYSIKKSYVDTWTFFFPEAVKEHKVGESIEYEKKYDEALSEFNKTAGERETADLAVKSDRAKLEALEKNVTAARARIEALTAEADKAKKKLEAIGPSFLNDWFRNRPITDFIDPTVRVKQTVIAGLRDDLFFAKVQKVDRCQTCHLAIDRKGFEGEILHVQGKGLVPVAKSAPKGSSYVLTMVDGHSETVEDSKVTDKIEIKAPFKSHPDLDRFLSSSSPHPIDKFGCTVCHLGEGQSLSFTTAAHTPNNESQRKEWEERKDLKWEIREHWNDTQFPTRYVEASCILCHANNRPVPGADKLNFGREVWERLSCVGCHKMKGYEDEAKRGPDLRRLTRKLTKDFVAYWVEDPARFRPKTNMPRFFNLDVPTTDEKKAAKTKEGVDYDVRTKVEIRAITEYLFDKSAEFVKDEDARGEAFTLPAWKKGDATRGKTLFTARGCVGCHRMEPLAVEAASLRTYAPDEFGPNLWNLGHKVKPEWAQAWIQNPKHYWAETKMPNLRVAEDEARDLATWLTEGLADKDGKSDVKDAQLPGFMPLAHMVEDEEKQLERACRDFLEKDYSTPEVERIFAGTDPVLPKLGNPAARLLYLGEQTVGRMGCFGCHYVKGMETRPGIGRELSDIGDKNLTQVDWGFESVAKDAPFKPENKIREVRHEWLNLKIEKPRIFDRGRIKAPLDRGRMPQFNTTKMEREALVTYLLGNTGNRKVSDEYRYRPSARKAYEVEGEYQIHRNNCKACHLFGTDRIALQQASQDGKSLVPVTMKQLDGRGEPVRSSITGEELTTKLFLDGLVLFDNTQIYGKDGGALIQLYQDPPAGSLGTKRAGDLVPVLADGDFRGIDEVRSPLVGAESDLERVVERMPDEVFGNAPAEAQAARAAQLAAIRKRVGSRNRGGLALEKVMHARATAKLGTDVLDPSEEAKKKFDATDPGLAPAFVEDGKTYGPPHLLGEGRKVQPLWLQSFLKNPVEIRPYLRPAQPWAEGKSASVLDAGGPHMPTYGFRDPEAQVYSRYFAAVDEDRRIELAKPLLETIARQVKIKDEKAPGYKEGFRSRLDIQSKVFAALDSLDAREYFALTIVDGVFNYAVRADVSLSRALEEKTTAYMEDREKGKRGARDTNGGPGWYSSAYRLFVHPDVNCQKCHIVRGQTPQGTVDAWAPDLANVRERLRPEYVQDWVDYPKAMIPGTKMPQLLLENKLRHILAGSSKGSRARNPKDPSSVPSDTTQVAAIVDWLLAGVPGVLEVFPRLDQPGTVLKAGAEVRLTSELLNLDEVKSIEVRAIDAQGALGAAEKTDVTPALREKSAERTTALKLPIQTSAKGKSYVITITDGRFTASADVTVAGD